MRIHCSRRCVAGLDWFRGAADLRPPSPRRTRSGRYARTCQSDRASAAHAAALSIPPVTIRPCDHACRTAEPLSLTRKFIDRIEFRSRDLLARTCCQLLLRRDISLRSEAGLAGAAGAVLNFEQLSIRTRKQVADRLSKAPGWMAFGTSTASPRPPLPPASFALALSSCSSRCIGRTKRGTATGLFRHNRGVKITCERCGRQKRHRVEAGLAMAMNRGRGSLRIMAAVPLIICTACVQRRAAIQPTGQFGLPRHGSAWATSTAGVLLVRAVSQAAQSADLITPATRTRATRTRENRRAAAAYQNLSERRGRV